MLCSRRYLPPGLRLHVWRLEHAADPVGLVVEVGVLGVDVGQLDGHDVLHLVIVVGVWWCVVVGGSVWCVVVCGGGG